MMSGNAFNSATQEEEEFLFASLYQTNKSFRLLDRMSVLKLSGWIELYLSGQLLERSSIHDSRTNNTLTLTQFDWSSLMNCNLYTRHRLDDDVLQATGS